MSFAAAYGPAITSTMVEQAVIATAQAWLPSYIETVLEASKLPSGSILYPIIWQSSYDFEDYRDLAMPAFVVVCDDSTGSVERYGDGDVGFWLTMQVGVLVEDQTEQSTRAVASIYRTACAMMLEQQAALGGIATQTLVTSLAMTLPVEDKRTVAYGEVTAETLIEPMYNRLAGPSSPTVALPDPGTAPNVVPPAETPLADNVIFTITSAADCEDLDEAQV